MTGEAAQDAPVNLLMIEFLSWLSSHQRTYDEAADAWRSTCPRHTVWEDAFIDGLVQIKTGDSPAQCGIALTPRGRAILEMCAKDI